MKNWAGQSQSKGMFDVSFFLSVGFWCYCDRWSICSQVCWNYGPTGKRWFLLTIVHRSNWLGRPAKSERQTNKLKLRWEVLEPPHLSFYPHWLCMNYINCVFCGKKRNKKKIIAMFLLVNRMSTRDHLLYFVRFCAGSTCKIANKNIQQGTLPGFLIISLY